MAKKRKKGLNLGVLRRGAKSRIKKLKDNIRKRDKAIRRARKRRDKKAAAAEIKEHRRLQRNAKVMIRGLEGVIRTMDDDSCPFTGQVDPLA